MGQGHDPTERRRFVRRRAAVATALFVVLALLLLGAFRLARSGSLPRVTVARTDVGALGEAELARRLEALAEGKAGEQIEVERGPVAGSPPLSEIYERGEAGYGFDIEATAARVLERGRQGNPVAALIDHVRATFGGIAVEPVETVEPEGLERWTAEVSEELAVTPSDGDLRFAAGVVRPVMPRPGALVEEDAFREVARRKLVEPGPQSIEVPVREVAPETTAAAVRAAASEARRILAEPVVVHRAGTEIELTPTELSRVLRTRASDDATLELKVAPKRLREVAGEALQELERSPEDASFTLEGGSVQVVPGRPGFALDYRKLAADLIDIATSENRRGKAAGRREAPEFSTADARKLRIDELVSTFTTEHSCCEPRVQNIHRIADMIDGTVVLPGETFSVNGAVGERTREKGFVPAPAIFEGEYVAEVGGGISQFATTMYNAIFFGGYEFLDYKAHSYYISRYPPGREATLSYPSVDLEFRNDSDYGIYIDTSYTDTSITVSFYGGDDVEVEASAGDPHNYKEPPVQCKVNRELGKKERRVVQEGKDGFDIVVHRIFPGSGRDPERFFTRYLPEPRIVERRSCR